MGRMKYFFRGLYYTCYECTYYLMYLIILMSIRNFFDLILLLISIKQLFTFNSDVCHQEVIEI